VSVYLDRLLRVDDQNYMHQNVMYFYITWIDYSAAEKISNSTMKMLNGSSALWACQLLEGCGGGWVDIHSTIHPMMPESSAAGNSFNLIALGSRAAGPEGDRGGGKWGQCCLLWIFVQRLT
jgi:hypothetical protein